MYKALLFQVSAILVVAALAGLLGGVVNARSALIGGVAYLLPNLLFVLRLQVAIAARGVNAVGFLVGEAIKLCVVIVLLLVLPQLVEVNWPALLAGLFVVLLVNLFALLLKT